MMELVIVQKLVLDHIILNLILMNAKNVMKGVHYVLNLQIQNVQNVLTVISLSLVRIHVLKSVR